MKIVFVRTKSNSTIFVRDANIKHEWDGASLEQMKISLKVGSSSRSICLGLKKYNLVTACEEWEFWHGPCQEISLPDEWAVKFFPLANNEKLASAELAQYIHTTGQPHILWVEGYDHPSYLRQIFELCPESFKIVYSKDWRPWKIEKLNHYDLCLVDEEWEVEKVKRRYPMLHCAVWDKLIDYETMHYPIPCDKIYDLCYVAYLRGRKNHVLLFEAMARLQDRKLTCLCIGDDRKGNRAELERLAADLNLSVDFTGEVPKEEINRYVNQSKVGVICSVLDAAPRAMLEYMAAGVPVLVNAKMLAGCRYVGPGAGLVKSPEEFHLGIAELLDNYRNYSPRAYYLERYSFEKVMAKFIGILKQAGCKIGNGIRD